MNYISKFRLISCSGGNEMIFQYQENNIDNWKNLEKEILSKEDFEKERKKFKKMHNNTVKIQLGW